MANFARWTKIRHSLFLTLIIELLTCCVSEYSEVIDL